MNILLILLSLISIFLILRYVLGVKFKILKNKTLLKLLLIGFLTIFLLSISTQNFAKLVGYKRVLGHPLIGHYYNPFSIIFWVIKYQYKAPNLLNKAIEIPFILLMTISLIIFIRVLKRNKKDDSEGSARWMKSSELKQLGYGKNKHEVEDGVILGRTKTSTGSFKTIVDNDNTHISVIAPTRSGKGVGIIIPTLLTWKSSTFVLDPKGENYALTSGYRKDVLKQKVLKFSPFSEEGSISYNPLSKIRIGSKHEFKDTEVISQIMMEKEGKELDHWGASGKVLLTGVILHVLYTISDRVASLGDVVDFLTSTEKPIAESLAEILEGKVKHSEDLKLFRKIYGKATNKGVPEGIHPIVGRMCAEILNKPDNERGSVISSTVTKLSLFKDPIIRKNTSSTDLEIMDLMNFKVPINLYLVIQPEDISLLSPFIRLILTQIVGTLCPEMNFKKRGAVHKHKLLLLLDEFPAFGKVAILEQGLAYIAGYGLKAVIIGQSLNQFKKIYTKEGSLLDNCATAVFYTPSPNDTETPKIISNLLGKETIKVKNKSNKIGEILGGSTTTSFKGRALLTEEEVRTKLGDKRNIISLAGKYPIMGHKIRFYEEEFFLNKTTEYGIPLTDTLNLNNQKGEDNE